MVAAVSEAEFREASGADEDFRVVRQYLDGKWPSRQRDVDPRAAAYYHVRDELS